MILKTVKYKLDHTSGFSTVCPGGVHVARIPPAGATFPCLCFYRGGGGETIYTMGGVSPTRSRTVKFCGYGETYADASLVIDAVVAAFDGIPLEVQSGVTLHGSFSVHNEHDGYDPDLRKFYTEYEAEIWYDKV